MPLERDTCHITTRHLLIFSTDAATTLEPIALASVEVLPGKTLPPPPLDDAPIASIMVPPPTTSLGDTLPPPVAVILPEAEDVEILNHNGHVDFYLMNIRTSRFTSVYLTPTNMGLIILRALL